MYEKFISDVCDMLKIYTPKILHDTSHFATKTMMAQCDSNGTTIFIRELNKPHPDVFFAIAHELRHIWQIRNDKQLYFSGYKPRNLCSSAEEYNLQVAELDANAFAGFVIKNYFGLTPLFENFSAPIKMQIYKRMKYFEIE